MCATMWVAKQSPAGSAQRGPTGSACQCRFVKASRRRSLSDGTIRPFCATGAKGPGLPRHSGERLRAASSDLTRFIAPRCMGPGLLPGYRLGRGRARGTASSKAGMARDARFFRGFSRSWENPAPALDTPTSWGHPFCPAQPLEVQHTAPIRWGGYCLPYSTGSPTHPRSTSFQSPGPRS